MNDQPRLPRPDDGPASALRLGRVELGRLLVLRRRVGEGRYEDDLRTDDREVKQ